MADVRTLQPLILPKAPLPPNGRFKPHSHIVWHADTQRFNKGAISFFDYAYTDSISRNSLELLQMICYLVQHPAMCRAFDNGGAGENSAEQDAWEDPSMRFELCKARESRELPLYLDGEPVQARIQCVSECLMDQSHEKMVGVRMHFLCFDPEWDWGVGFALAVELFRGRKREVEAKAAEAMARNGRPLSLTYSATFNPEMCHRLICAPQLYWAACLTYLQVGHTDTPTSWAQLQSNPNWMMDITNDMHPLEVFSIENACRLAQRHKENNGLGEYALRINAVQGTAINYESGGMAMGDVGVIVMPITLRCRLFPMAEVISTNVMPRLRLPTPCHPPDPAGFNHLKSSDLVRMLQAVWKQCAGGVKPVMLDVFGKIRKEAVSEAQMAKAIEVIVRDETIDDDCLLGAIRGRFMALRLKSIVDISCSLLNPEELPFFEQNMYGWYERRIRHKRESAMMLAVDDDDDMAENQGIQFTVPEKYRRILRPEMTCFGNYMQELYSNMDELLGAATCHSTLSLLLVARHSGTRCFTSGADSAKGGLHVLLRGDGDVGKSWILDKLKMLSIEGSTADHGYSSKCAGLTDDTVGHSARAKKQGRIHNEMQWEVLNGFGNDKTGNTATKNALEEGVADIQRATMKEDESGGQICVLLKTHLELNGYTFGATNESADSAKTQGNDLRAVLSRFHSVAVGQPPRPGMDSASRSSEELSTDDKIKKEWYVDSLRAEQFWCNIIEIGHYCFNLRIDTRVGDIVVSQMIEFFKKRGNQITGSRDKKRVIKCCRCLAMMYAQFLVFNDPSSPLFEHEFTLESLQLDVFYKEVAPRLVVTHEIAVFAFGLMLDAFQAPSDQLRSVLLALLVEKAKMPVDRFVWPAEQGAIKFKYNDRDGTTDYDYFEITGCSSLGEIAKVAAAGSGAYGFDVSAANAEKYLEGLNGHNSIGFFKRNGPGINDINIVAKSNLPILIRVPGAEGKWHFSVEAAKYFTCFSTTTKENYGDYSNLYHEAVKSTFDSFTPVQTWATGLTRVNEHCPQVLAVVEAVPVPQTESGSKLTTGRSSVGLVTYSREHPTAYVMASHAASLHLCDLDSGRAVLGQLDEQGCHHLTFEGATEAWETYKDENPDLISEKDFVETKITAAQQLAQQVALRSGSRRHRIWDDGYVNEQSPSRGRISSLKRRRLELRLPPPLEGGD